ncbi:hypothetical protein VB715_17555 [Crocosphaera sp. UHCC 0190]|uniref:hypothetical protein n=1 Tax=Crocosphaera sp. UHCC 0190 TaxID=3110246 RepID=UPI002B2115FF|nr:hypothetical protein [Crocosphaera sp. UHCC 0190]MEA5511583.1 hypothetical protein [Crocosphaera sp. UHCC 0190]
MNNLPSYWTLCCLSLNHPRGYEFKKLTTAQTWLEKQTNISDTSQVVIDILMTLFRQRQKKNLRQNALAGLCLRCYVSSPILKACKSLANRFSSHQLFTHQDLLSFVLDDDGESLIVLDETEENQVILDEQNLTKSRQYQLFTVEILQSYQSQKANRLSLSNWAYKKTEQNSELVKFLEDFGFKNLSDWALLNRIRQHQLADFSPKDQEIIKAFHKIYRRDRRQQKAKSKCLDPSIIQLQEMGELLPKLKNHEPDILVKELRRIAAQLRTYNVWQSKESLEIFDADEGGTSTREIAYEGVDEVAIEENEILTKLNQELEKIFHKSLVQSLEYRLNKLKKSKNYAPYAEQFLPVLNSYYQEAKPIKEIAEAMNISWDKARRIFNPGDLLKQIRTTTTNQLVEYLLKLAQAKGLTTNPPDVNYLMTLTTQIEAFTDHKIFEEAASEIRAGKNRKFESFYAKTLKEYLTK